MGALSARLDHLYGARIDYTVRKKGEDQCVGFVASFIDDSFAPGGEKLLEPVAELLGELICDPATERGRFVPAYFERKRPTSSMRSAVSSMTSGIMQTAAFCGRCAPENRTRSAGWETRTP